MMKYFFALLIVLFTFASCASTSVDVSDCDEGGSGCLPTETCLEAPPSSGKSIYLKVSSSLSDFKLKIYSDSTCSFAIATIETEDCAQDTCCKMHAYSMGQDITDEIGDMYLKYEINDCNPAAMGVTDSADGIIMKNLDVRSIEMRSFISKTLEYYFNNGKVQATGYSTLVVGCLFLVGMVAGSGITAVANRSNKRYSHLSSVEHTAMSGYQSSSVSEHTVNDL